MFIILTRATLNTEAVFLMETDGPAEALASLRSFLPDYPHAFLAEVLIPGADPRTAIPGELDRAITEWNAMTDRVNIHIDKVKERSRFVAPYRKWVKAAGRRDYFFEQLIADVEAQPYIWPTIRFGWLLRSARTKDGELNSEKIHARAYGKGGNGNGQITEAGYLALARTVRKWRDEHDWSRVGGNGGPDPDYDAAFEHGTGVSQQRFEELRKRFNGGVNV